jgi:hypothetical protein
MIDLDLATTAQIAGGATEDLWRLQIHGEDDWESPRMLTDAFPAT